MRLWYQPVGWFNISYNVLQDSATYADMSFVSDENNQKQSHKEQEGGETQRVCSLWLCMS